MPGTYSQLLLHIVFSTKHRQPWITPDMAARLYPYIGGIVRAEKGVMFDAGGVADHIHLFMRWRPDESVSNLMRTVKSRSSLWVHQTFSTPETFAWQEGYSVFSVSKSQESAVKAYISAKISSPNCFDCCEHMKSSLKNGMCSIDDRCAPPPPSGRKRSSPSIHG